MIRYAILLVGPLIIGTLIAIGLLLVSGFRERRERTRRELDEARRSERAMSAHDLEDRRIAS